MKNEIVIFENQGVRLEVNLQDETVWLTQAQMALLFNVNQRTISDHINNIFNEKELIKETSTGKIGKSSGGRISVAYNLDVIISVSYRVKSQNGIIFRKWANKVLKEYLLNGYAINQKRLDYLEKTVKLINLVNRSRELFNGDEIKSVLEVISSYTKALE